MSTLPAHMRPLIQVKTTDGDVHRLYHSTESWPQFIFLLQLRLSLENGLRHRKFVRLLVPPLLPPLNGGLPPGRVPIRYEPLDVVSYDSCHDGYGEHDHRGVSPRCCNDPGPHFGSEKFDLHIIHLLSRSFLNIHYQSKKQLRTYIYQKRGWLNFDTS